jgi:hypothetical protein
VVGATVGGDDEVRLQVGADRLHEDVDDRVLALAAGGVADHPAHGVAGRDRDQLLSRLEGDVGDLGRRGVELVERTLGVRVDLNGVDVAVLGRLDACIRVGKLDPLLGLLLVLHLLLLLRDGLELARQRERLRHLDNLHGGLRVRLAVRRFERRAIEDRDLRHAHRRRAGGNGEGDSDCRPKSGTQAHLPSPFDVATSCDQLKVCT